jgi:glycosyltransferase involved in cell wall biosynthesis
MKKPPMFSVVIPLYNKQAYVQRAVESVLRQDDADYELIVVDDGSTDGSVAAIQAIKDARMSLIQQANAGVGAARNTGIARARGAWIAFLDADDAWWPEHLSELRRIIAMIPEAGLVATASMETTAATLPSRVNRRSSQVTRIDYFLQASRRIGIINSSCSAIRQDVPTVVGGFSTQHAGEDLEFWARIALQFEVAISQRITSAYFRGTGGAMERLSSHPTIGSDGVRLSDLSPSVAILCASASKNPGLWENQSVRRYINSRAESAIHAALHHGDWHGACSYAALLAPPLSGAQRLYRCATALPVTLQVVMVAAYRTARRLMHAVSAKWHRAEHKLG